jgi:hypothetical protein
MYRLFPASCLKQLGAVIEDVFVFEEESGEC